MNTIKKLKIKFRAQNTNTDEKKADDHEIGHILQHSK